MPSIPAPQEYVNYRRFPRGLAARIRNFYEHFASNTCPFDENGILTKLTPRLQEEAVNFLLADTIQCVPLIADLRDSMRMAIFNKLVPCTYSGREVIFHKGDVADELMFLIDGVVKAIYAPVTFMPSVRCVSDLKSRAPPCVNLLPNNGIYTFVSCSCI